MVDELQTIKRFFEEKGIPLSMEWLESCVKWCKEDNLPSNYTLKDLRMLVFEQWLFLDFTEVEIPSLPRGLSSQKSFLLTGSYYLQLLQVVDVSKPKLWQLQRIRNNIVAKNAENENTFGKRVLVLTLTDGVQQVEAMEFKPIPCLNINLDPGTKIKVTGPLTVKIGTLMLENQHVKILGGSVDEIKIKNAAENVLARALGLRENPNPFPIDQNELEATDTNTTNPDTKPGDITHSQANRNVKNNDNLPLQTNTQIVSESNKILPPINRNNINNDISSEILRELEDDFDLEPNISSFSRKLPCASTSTQITNINNVHLQTQKTRQTVCSSPDLFEDMDTDLLNGHFNQINGEDVDLGSPVKELRVEYSSINSTKKTKMDIVQDVNVISSIEKDELKDNEEIIVLDDSFEDIDYDFQIDKINREMADIPCSTQLTHSFKDIMSSPKPKGPLGLSLKPNNTKKLTQSKLSFACSSKTNTERLIKNKKAVPSTVSPVKIPSISKATQRHSSPETYKKSPKSLNVMSIEKLKNLLPNISRGKFKIKAKFMKVAERMIIVDKCFYFIIVLKDASGELVVQVDSDVVAGLAEISAEKLEAKKEFVLRNDKDVKHIIMQALANIHRKVINIHNILEVQVTRGEKYPVIVNIL